MSSASDGELCEVPPKKIKSEWCKSYSNKAMQMMCKMGYKADKGLGKQGQGRLEPVEAFHQDGRRGFGLKLKLLNSSQIWDPECEEILIPEPIAWLKCTECTFKYEEMCEWFLQGPKKETLDDETTFCDPEILSNILESKSVFNELNGSDMRRARSRSNPFETIRSSIFLNRAAVKMANIDYLCDYMFTNPRDEYGNSIVADDELLYFADICAGPGGFSEYVLYRKAWEAKGFGFTLRDANDFKLEKFFAASPESFDPFYGIENDGNIFNESNQRSLKEYVYKHCKGVHFVMADGGFSVEGQENIQEILSKQLYLCQCLTALSILRKNGHFVCKLFDTFTHFSVGLIYLMYMCFKEICISKPNTSRPANSERYLICKWKKSNVDEVCNYLNYINQYFNTNESTGQDVIEIVSYEVLLQNTSFLDYVIESNNKIGQNQIVGLKKIAAFCQNQQLKEYRQTDVRKQCITLWNLPDKLRHAPEIKSTEKLLEEILETWYENKTFLSAAPFELKLYEFLSKKIESIYDWVFVPIGRGETSVNVCSMFLCRSRGNLLRMTETKKWEPVEFLFEISPKSLFYGEIVYEYCGEGRTQTRVCGLHIIDAVMLGGKDIRRLKLRDRVKICNKFASSLNKPYKEGVVTKILPIRCKKLYELKDIETFFNGMRQYNLKDNSSRLGFGLDTQFVENKFFVPGGILLFCEISNNFFSKISKSTNSLYYFDKTKNSSHYIDNMPNDLKSTLYASFRNSFIRRLQWKWTNTKQVEEQCHKKDQSILYRDDMKNFIFNK